jgi:hypothetical protein
MGLGRCAAIELTALGLVAALGSAACRRESAEDRWTIAASATPVRPPEDPQDPRPSFEDGGAPAGGFGAVSARVPGTPQEVSTVRLGAHRVTTTIAGGFARTFVEEEIVNDDERALEAKLSFLLPEGAVLSHLALLVGDRWVRAEVEEKGKIGRIFKNIVDDTVRPKDPALLERIAGTRCSLRIFPVPAHGRRKAAFAYDQALPRVEDKFVYRLPLGDSSARRSPVDELSLTLRLPDATTGPLDGSVGWPLVRDETDAEPGHSGEQIWRYRGTNLTPAADWEVTTRAGTAPLLTRATPTVATPGEAALDYVALRLKLAEGKPGISSSSLTNTPPSPAAPPDRVAVVVDTSHAQSGETRRTWREQLWAGLASLPPATEVRVFACDSGCVEGPRAHGGGRRAEVDAWLASRPLRGSANVGEALRRGLAALEGATSGALLYVGEGAPTSGERAAGPMLARLRPLVDAHRATVLLWGVGRGVDGATLDALAAGLAGSRVTADDVGRLETFLTTPRLRELRVELPPGFGPLVGVLPAEKGLDDELVLLTRAAAGASGDVVVRGTIDQRDDERSFPVALTPDSPRHPSIENLWVKARIDELEQGDSPAQITEAVALSKRTRVLGRHTTLVAMENDAMFAAYGITRTPRDGSLDEKTAPWGEPAVVSAAPGTAFGAGHGAGSGAGSLGDVGLGLEGSHRTQVPRLRLSPPTVQGGLPPAVIQRIARQQLGRLRLCYEVATRSEPGLAGSLRVRFVIAADGSVGLVVVTPGTLGNPTMLACVRRVFGALSFPRPEGGIVTVTMPVQFSQEASTSGFEGGWRRSFAAAPVTATMKPGSDEWRSRSPEAETALAGLRAAVDKEPASRTAHEALVRGWMVRGRFAEAVVSARHLTTIDPDSALAWSLLAEASVVTGDLETTVAALDTIAALAPDAVQGHLNAARAYHEAGDLARSCAHFQALGRGLDPGVTDAVRAETFRCRAAVFSERAEVLREASAIAHPGPLVRALLATLQQDKSLDYTDPTPPGPVSASLDCQSPCPLLALLTPRGRIVSALTPGVTQARRTALPGARSNGTYRILLLGERSRAHPTLSVTVQADGLRQRFSATADGPLTVATLTVLRDDRGGFGLASLR